MNSLHQKLTRLALTTMSHNLDQVLSDTSKQNLSLAAALESLVDMELDARRSRAVERRFRSARIGARCSIDGFQFNHHKSRLQMKSRILHLMDLDFVHHGANIVIIGNPGKTFLAKIIAWRACQANQRVLFTTAMDMLNHLSAAQADHSLVRKLKIYTEPSLLVCDELGYLSLDQQTSNLFIRSSRRVTAASGVR